ncbi:hypothetical protein M0802_009181 [Mischocyttarus mexicanus]|nr:hypothetical protein M0802_009181 [Mischocyttarus mexicanus]
MSAEASHRSSSVGNYDDDEDNDDDDDEIYPSISRNFQQEGKATDELEEETRMNIYPEWDADRTVKAARDSRPQRIKPPGRDLPSPIKHKPKA